MQAGDDHPAHPPVVHIIRPDEGPAVPAGTTNADSGIRMIWSTFDGQFLRDRRGCRRIVSATTVLGVGRLLVSLVVSLLPRHIEKRG